MKEIKDFSELGKLNVNQKILYSFRKHRWYGRYKGIKKHLHIIDLVNCLNGDKSRNFNISDDFFKGKTTWKIFKLTKNEFDKIKLEVVVNKI